jgi:uncharacterized protein involved in outer membrane biogenesis
MPRGITLIVVVVGVLIGVFAVKNIVIKAAVTGGVKAVTGLGLEIDHLDVAFLQGAVEVDGLRIRNPRGFPDPVMVSMPELFVDVNPAGFFKGETHVEALRVNIEEFLVVRNAQGALNLDSLKAVQASKAPAEQRQTPSAGTLRVDSLELHVGRVVFKDYSKGGEPQVREFPVNLNERHENIGNPQALGALIVSKALAKTTIASLTNLDLQALESTFSGAVGKATELVGTAAESAKQLQQQASDQLKESSAGVQAAVREAGDTGRKAAAGVTSAGKEAVSGAKDAVQGAGQTLKKVLPFGN